MSEKNLNYKDSGVDIEAANEGLKRIKSHVNSTFNNYTLSDVGSFGGCFQFPQNKYKIEKNIFSIIKKNSLVRNILIPEKIRVIEIK